MTRRTALITDGTTGIGLAICKKMKDLGYTVASTCRDEKQARVWQDRMEKEGYLFFVFPCEASNRAECLKTMEEIARYLGPIQILVNTAENGVDDAFNVTHAVMDRMLDSGFGRIINVAHDGNSAGEAALVHELTGALAREAAEKNVTVNTISRIRVQKPTLSEIFGRRHGIADLVAFLAQEESAGITGTNITVCH